MNPAWAGQIHSQMSKSLSASTTALASECCDAGNNNSPIDFCPSGTSIRNLPSTSSGQTSQHFCRQTSQVSALHVSTTSASPINAMSKDNVDFDSESTDIEDIPNPVPIETTDYGTLIGSKIRKRRRKSAVSTESAIDDNSPTMEKMRRKLRFFFMNPLEKWKAKKRFPYKLVIQVIKIFFVTFQLCLFATYRYANVNYTWDNKLTFSHLFVKDWDPAREIITYPPTTGALAVYTKEEFFNYLDHAVKTYANIENIAIGPYFYETENNTISGMNFCIESYTSGIIFGFNESYIFDSATEEHCLELPASVITNSTESFSSEQYFRAQNFTISFDSLLEADLSFILKTVRFRDLGPFKSPDCFRFEIDMLFNNRDHDGQVLVDLEIQPTRLRCKGGENYIADNRLERLGRSGVNYIVIGMCTMSLVLCCRAIYRAQVLKKETVAFFKRYFNQDLNVEDRLEFLNFWYLLIMLNDLLIIIGSAVKEQIENKELTGEAWNVCSVLLGIGNLLVWFGVLRYLGFFKTYNVLILTLRRATPNVLRFLICALLIYSGFTFCGWLILGPYHLKFSTLSTTSECLFSLINGDDMFATFASMSSKSNLLWWFCRLYLYTFISLFIYVVLSLFIALIMDAYETIKLYYQEGFPKTALQEFILGPDIIENQPPSPPYSVNCCHHHPGMSLSRHSSAADLGRKSSVAGGLLDTIVETLCGCNASTEIQNRSTSGESQPLLA